jgi:NitT/TauT family transport system permease protein
VRNFLRNKTVKTLLFFTIILVIWQLIFSLKLFSPILFPSLADIAVAFIKQIADGSIIVRSGFSLYLIFIGIIVSIVGAVILTILSSVSKTAEDIIASVTALVDPLPGIAMLPLAILWFGTGNASIIFVIVHSVMWPVLLNITTGFTSVPPIYTEIGRNIGLSRGRLLVGVYLPASLPNILVGLRTGWSRAWRALISAEMVFGATGKTGGLGWDIYMKRSFMDIPGLYATLVVIMLIGLLIEAVVFKQIETRTVKKWGMVR